MLWAIPLWLFKLIITVSGKPTSSSSQFAGPSFSSQDRDIVDVKLYTLGNSTIRAVVTNIGNDHLQLIKSGSILDENRPTRKVSIEGNARFTGVRVDYINSHLSPDAFVYLAPNQTIESVFNVAKFYDLVPGERYYAFASGYLEYIRSTVPNLFSSVAYTSNKVTFDAPRVLNKAITSRATLIACDAQYNDAMRQALDRVAKMAMAAAQEAREGGERLKVYFNSTSPEVRKEVADRLDAIANEATSKGTVNYYCKDTKHECYGNVAALTFPYENRIINCLPYYETLQSQTNVITWIRRDFLYTNSPMRLVYITQSALHNADSYAYYANSVFHDCAEDDRQGLGLIRHGGENGVSNSNPDTQTLIGSNNRIIPNGVDGIWIKNDDGTFDYLKYGRDGQGNTRYSNVNDDGSSYQVTGMDGNLRWNVHDEVYDYVGSDGSSYHDIPLTYDTSAKA